MVQNIDYLGSAPLFLGVETSGWNLTQFQSAAKAAKALGITSLLVKIADGTNQWYNGIGGWEKVLDTVNQSGCKAVPYTYCYGQAFGGLGGEDSILVAAMKHSGIVVADMETEYNGHADWASTVAAALKSLPGILGITTWADPELQSWIPVLAALKPSVNFWLPQVYNDFLAGDYHARFDAFGLPYYPVLNLGADFGANNILQTAKNANSPIIAFWEYAAAIANYASIVKEAIKFVTAPPAQPKQDALTRYEQNPHIKQELDECWKAIVGYGPGSGIWKTWIALWLDHNIHAGPPLRGEYTSIDASGKSMQVLECAHLRCEWYDEQHYAWYGTAGPIKV